MVFNNPIPCHRGGGGEGCPEARIETTIKPIKQHLDGKTIKASNKWWLKLNRLLGASEKIHKSKTTQFRANVSGYILLLEEWVRE